MSADSSVAIGSSGADRQSLRDLLTGPVTSIAVALLVVIVVGFTWVGPRFLSVSNVTIIGTFVAVPMLVAAFAGFALLAGVVDLSIGSMLGLSSTLSATLMTDDDRIGLGGGEGACPRGRALRLVRAAGAWERWKT